MLSVLSMMEEHLEDEEEDHHHPAEDDPSPHHHTVPLSKAELRKSNKPIMEKRRRARINTCLNELKSLILDAMKKDPARHSKLEKADILEMTVKHLQAVQRQQLALAVAHDPAVLTKFRGGFAECAQEVTRYVSRIEGVDAGVRQRLLQHLGQCVSGLSAMTPLSFTAMAGLPLPLAHLQGTAIPQAPPPQLQQSPGDVNNNQARLLHGLVAARLAAAGDTAGAALLLHGGLSLLARAGPHGTAQPNAQQAPPPVSSQGPHTAPPPQQTAIQPPQGLQHSLTKINEGASSSGERPLRPSAFTAVRRASSPPRAQLEPHIRPQESLPSTQMQTIIAPTARRIFTVPDHKQETVISAQVAVQPVNLTLQSAGSHEGDIRTPIDFSFKKRQLERPTPTHPTISIPTPKHPTTSQVFPAHIGQKDSLLQHPSSTHVGVTNPALTQTTSTHCTVPHTVPTSSQSIATEPAATNLSLTTPHHSHPYHTSLSSVLSMPSPTVTLPDQYESTNTSALDKPREKRPLEDPESSNPPSKISKTDKPSHGLIPAPLPLKMTPPDTPTAPLVPSAVIPHRMSPPPITPLPLSESSPQQEINQPGPSPKKTPPPPSPHPSGSSPPIGATTPKKEVTSEDNASPDRPSTSAPQEDKDMWRPW
ncbi:uncharacterized protein [Macrobrachium rosenbergii]|uniref:uncharacterized protein n=1 Tax=Macrobrachium rosenbergii TaxID=79674 RepID=UPI0034D3C4DC